MIKYIPYSMFDAFDNQNIQTVVNTVNCMGIMGKGLAFEFKTRYPEMYNDYLVRFKNDELKVGEPYLYKTSGKWILNFPTKNHWRYPSKIEFVESGLRFFVTHYQKWAVKSIAFPRLGCTSGNLEWSQVKPVMDRYLDDLKDIDVYVFLDRTVSDTENTILKAINELNRNDLQQIFKLNDKQSSSLKEYIKKHGPLKRLRDLLEIKGIGAVAYQRAIARRNIQIISQGEFGFR